MFHKNFIPEVLIKNKLFMQVFRLVSHSRHLPGISVVKIQDAYFIVDTIKQKHTATGIALALIQIPFHKTRQIYVFFQYLNYICSQFSN